MRDASSPDLPDSTGGHQADASTGGDGSDGGGLLPDSGSDLGDGPDDAGAPMDGAISSSPDGSVEPLDASVDPLADGGKTSDADAATLPDAGGLPPTGWTCDESVYGAADGCDCSCGVMDSDCAGATQCDHAPAVDLVVVSSDELQGKGAATFEGAVSDDGRFVVFASGASNLVAGDANSQTDVFVRDRMLGTTQRVSVGLGGGDANGSSAQPSITADGRFVAFVSSASNLIESDTNSAADAFVANLQDGSIERVATSVARCQIAANGTRVALDVSSSIYVYDREQRTTERVNEYPAGTVLPGSQFGRISADGKFVVFASAGRIYRHELETSTTVLVSVSTTGMPSYGYIASVSANGRYVAFDSGASDLVENDTNGVEDVFVRDMDLGTTRRVSVSAAGEQNALPSQGPYISSDGQRVVFTGEHDGGGWGNVSLWDSSASTTRVVGPGVANAVESISANGRWATFSSATSNLVPNDTNGTYDLFVVPLDE